MLKTLYPLVSITFVIGCYDAPAPKTRPTTKKVAPEASQQVELQILDWDGLQKLLADKRGKVVVLDCWSTSCAPCIREFPNLVALQKKHGPEKLACVSLSFDYEGIGRPEDQREPVLKFLRQQNATFANVLSSVESDALTDKLGIPSIPAVFVYDRDGRLRKRFDNRYASRDGGPFNYEQVAALVAEILAESPP